MLSNSRCLPPLGCFLVAKLTNSSDALALVTHEWHEDRERAH